MSYFKGKLLAIVKILRLNLKKKLLAIVKNLCLDLKKQKHLPRSNSFHIDFMSYNLKKKLLDIVIIP